MQNAVLRQSSKLFNLLNYNIDPFVLSEALERLTGCLNVKFHLRKYVEE